MSELQWPSESLRSAVPFGRRIGTFLERLPKSVMVIASYAILGLVAVFDYRATPAHLTLLMYYLVPIFLLAWFVSPAQDVIIAVACAAINLAIDLNLIHEFPNSWDPLLNDFVAAGVYIIAARAASLVRALIEFEQALSRTDPGTGAANRRAFFERAEYELSRARRDQQPLTTV